VRPNRCEPLFAKFSALIFTTIYKWRAAGERVERLKEAQEETRFVFLGEGVDFGKVGMVFTVG